jgi:hypothetical protein
MQMDGLIQKKAPLDIALASLIAIFKEEVALVLLRFVHSSNCSIRKMLFQYFIQILVCGISIAGSV